MYVPSKTVLTNGKPKARVLWLAANAAATASFLDKLINGDLKREKRPRSEPVCNNGRIVSKVMTFVASSPNPLENALQNAFHTIPNNMS